MPKASAIQSSFNAGELTPRLRGRVDLDKYKNGCETLTNFIPQIHGPIKKRPGSRFVSVAAVNDFFNQDYPAGLIPHPEGVPGPIRLIPFEYSTTQAYVMEFYRYNIRFYKDGALVMSGGSPYTVYTPYEDIELQDLYYAQSADVVYIAHPNHPPYKLSRFSDTSWTMTEVVFDWPPFNDENTTVTTIVTSGTTGTVSLTASASLFSSSDVGTFVKFEETIESKTDKWLQAKAISVGAKRVYDGSLYEAVTSGTTGNRPPIHAKGDESDGGVTWRYLHNGSGYVEITSYTSATLVTGDVIKRLPDSASSSGSLRWSEGSWSDNKGHPKTVAFYEDRLWFAGSLDNPQTLWASVSGDYENHYYGSDDDDALNYTINSQEVNTIEWMMPGTVLTVGTSGNEFTVRASNINEAVTPTNVKISPHTSYGSAPRKPIRIGNAVLFIQRSLRKIREFTYTFQADNYVAPDLTMLAEHISQDGMYDIAYQQEPSQVLWMPSAEGVVLGMTYEREEDVVAWHKHDLGGINEPNLPTMFGRPNSIESITTIPHWDGDQDVVWIVIRRVVDGTVYRYVEYIEKYKTDDYAFFVDSGITYDGSSTTSITGLAHLIGREVSILADGAVQANQTVPPSGTITLTTAASIVNVGLPIIATVKTMPLDAGAADGTAQGKTKRITNTTVRLDETGPGLKYGPDTSNMNEYVLRKTGTPMGLAVPLFTGDTEPLPWPDGYDGDAQVTLQHASPTPCTIIAVMPQVHTYDR